MAQSGVSSCVHSIIASFTSELDVFKKFRELRKSKKGRQKRQSSGGDQDEQQLMRSLRKGPEVIGREYQRSISAVGDRFAQGDAATNTALAEVLLKLNTSLVIVINAFLQKEKREPDLDYRSLTAIADASRAETCQALRQLYRRLTQETSRVARDIGSPDPAERAGRSSSATRCGRRGPVLARVVIADSSKPSRVAMVRPGEREKHKRSNALNSIASLAARSGELVPARQTSPTLTIHQNGSSRMIARSEKKSNVQTARKSHASIEKHSAKDLGSSASLLLTLRADNVVAEGVVQPRRLNKPTPTYCSEASYMTKLGEIPLHKWAEPIDFDAMSRLNKEAMRNGWPFCEMNDTGPKKSRRGIFKLFRRSTNDQ
ncbi:hypothetical protein Slin15195_G123630 [Septoria linicola]|uniref:Uncharacterized protein n=1 Tax=Septoria linicola TaxID=215465 RepID=A0A9Q9B144_9PEZI|nr:hypothetical protein Slin14017_G079830 [Septoria linicola]USW59044.1 hypothetical protein Slin15195_G123630 [Septoria linicola]